MGAGGGLKRGGFGRFHVGALLEGNESTWRGRGAAEQRAAAAARGGSWGERRFNRKRCVLSLVHSRPSWILSLEEEEEEEEEGGNKSIVFFLAHRWSDVLISRRKLVSGWSVGSKEG